MPVAACPAAEGSVEDARGIRGAQAPAGRTAV